MRVLTIMAGDLRIVGFTFVLLTLLVMPSYLATAVPVLTNLTSEPDVPPPDFTFLPPDFTLPPSTPRPHCQHPEECCVHSLESEEFDRCCEQHGCCPTECPITLPGGSIPPSKGCNAWECCVYSQWSRDWRSCCKRHGCCPVCDQFSSGCCFNGLIYAFKNVVIDLPKICLQLVCAAKLLPAPRCLVATIVPVKTCEFPDSTHTCVHCPMHDCVDDTGLVRSNGDVWSPSQCIQCECRFGRFNCIILNQHCQPPPQPSCIALPIPPGQCCPTYNCHKCVDEDGTFRPLHSEWPSKDPCVTFLCTATGIDTITLACRPPPQPHEGCFLQPVQDECCPTWNCSHCRDTDGALHPLGDEWQTDPCQIKICAATGIAVKPVPCIPLAPRPHPTCYKGLTKGGCCEEWKCDGCFENDVLHAPGEIWPTSDPCINNLCTHLGIVQRPVTCPDFPKPHESCFQFTKQEECCQTWNCSGCLDFNGNYHPQFEEWQTDPCTVQVCHLDGITARPIKCPPLGPALHPSCRKVPTYKGCCEEWKCNGCVDKQGMFHPLLQTWKSDPCTSHICTKDGIQTYVALCLPPPQPNPSCHLVSPAFSCCKIWECKYGGTNKTCYHEGNHYNDGAKWSAKEHCVLHHCVSGTIETDRVQCHQEIPAGNCFRELYEGDCCPTWNCSGCTDQHGKPRLHEEEWTSSEPCLVFRCQDSKIKPRLIDCKESLPPYPICFKTRDEGQCCHTWNCSGCQDDMGNFHPIGNSWTSMCISHTCTQHGVASRAIDCPPSPALGCVEVSSTDSCCPNWQCEVDHCASELCQGPPHENCTSYTPPGQCCPIFDCRPQKPDCTEVKCREHKSDEYMFCTSYTSPGYCCPIYTCRPHHLTASTRATKFCTDEHGNMRKNDEVWQITEDDCKRAQCHKGVIIDHYLC